MKTKLKTALVPMGKEGYKTGDLIQHNHDKSLAIAPNTCIKSLNSKAMQLLYIDESAEVKEGDKVYSDDHKNISTIVNPVPKETSVLKDYKIIASYPHITGTLPISIEDAREWCENPSEVVEIEIDKIVSDECVLGLEYSYAAKLSPSGCVVMVKEEKPFGENKMFIPKGWKPFDQLSDKEKAEIPDAWLSKIGIKNSDKTTSVEDSARVSFTVTDMLNAISYGFGYHRDSQSDNIDVPLGNKLQWILGSFIKPENWKKFVQDYKQSLTK